MSELICGFMMYSIWTYYIHSFHIQYQCRHTRTQSPCDENTLIHTDPIRFPSVSVHFSAAEASDRLESDIEDDMFVLSPTPSQVPSLQDELDPGGPHLPPWNAQRFRRETRRATAMRGPCSRRHCCCCCCCCCCCQWWWWCCCFCCCWCCCCCSCSSSCSCWGWVVGAVDDGRSWSILMDVDTCWWMVPSFWKLLAGDLGMTPPSKPGRFWKVHMMAARSGGQVELYYDLMTGGSVAVKHLPRSRLRDSPQSYQEAWPGEVENPWKEIEIMRLGRN